MATFKIKDNEIVVFGKYHKSIFGDRDRSGGKLEPDEPAHWEITEIYLNGIESDIYDICDELDVNCDQFIDRCERALKSDFLEY